MGFFKRPKRTTRVPWLSARPIRTTCGCAAAAALVR